MSSGLIRGILPNEVAAAEMAGDVPASPLLPGEQAFVADASDARRDAFTGGRACARAALAELGIPPLEIGIGPGGAPQWPEGISGSITHCDGYQAAAAVRTTIIRSIGIDGEPAFPLPHGVIEEIASPAERAHLTEVSAAFPHFSWGRLLFSAKESVYKAWYPQTAQWLDFADVTVEIQPSRGSFTALVQHPAAPALGLSRMSGRWAVGSGVVVTAVVILATVGARRGPSSMPCRGLSQ